MDYKVKKKKLIAQPHAYRSSHKHRAVELREDKGRPPLGAQHVHSESSEGAIELMALAMRLEGCTYAEICQTLDIGADLARRFVESAAKHSLDDPLTELHMHQIRLKALLQRWAPLAQNRNGEAADTKESLAASKHCLEILAMVQHLGIWMEHLPSKRGSGVEEDFYAEAKAILMEEVSGEGEAHSPERWGPALEPPLLAETPQLADDPPPAGHGEDLPQERAAVPSGASRFAGCDRLW